MKIKDFVPPIIGKGINTVRSLIGSLLNYKNESEYRAILSKNRNLKDKHLGQRCFILATGSSIAKMNLKPLIGEICIGLNEFHLHPDYNLIKPRYMVFSGFGIHTVDPDRHEKWYKHYCEITHSVSIPLINICDYKFISTRDLLLHNEKYFFQLGLSYNRLPHLGIDATSKLYASQGVGAMAIQMALYMGFSEIILVGFDHDWLLRMFDLNPTHFYDHNKSVIYKGHNEVESTTVSYQAMSLIKLFANYEALNSYAASQGITICNATLGGMLDVFPRVEFNDVVAKADS
jgi:hypothetical protein